MAAPVAYRRRKHGGGRAVFLLAAAALLGTGGYWLRNADLDALAQRVFGPGSEVELPTAPLPRGNAAKTPASPQLPPADALSLVPAAPDLPMAEMPAAVGADADDAKAVGWPAIAPAALLEQASGFGDRALHAQAFDRPPWQRYARPFTAPEGRPLIGILVTGLGGDRTIAAAAIAGLPPDVTLSFDPMAPDLADWIAAARAFGHEAMIDLPMQPKDGTDVSPQGLAIGLNDGEMARRIDAAAEAGPQSIGFAAPGGDAPLLDDRAMTAALAEIARLGRGFIDTSGAPMSQAPVTADAAGLPFARSMVRLDETASRTALTEQLAVLAQTAIAHGSALACARASPAAIVGIADWVRRQSDDGPVLAPASALMKP